MTKLISPIQTESSSLHACGNKISPKGKKEEEKQKKSLKQQNKLKPEFPT